MDSNKTIYYAKDLDEVFYQLKTISSLHIVGGCTATAPLPEKTLSVRAVPELCTFDKFERHFDFGSAVTLAHIEAVGQNNLPSVLYEALRGMANPPVKNLATIGGNICCPDHKHTLYAPLLALDARLELRNGQKTDYIPIIQFNGTPKGFLLTKIRVPIEEWEVAVFRRLGPAHIITDMSAAFVFLANTQNGQLSNLRIAFAGSFWFRSPELENKLIGSHLPIPTTSIRELMEEAKVQFDRAAGGTAVMPILKDQFLNVVKYSLEQLT